MHEAVYSPHYDFFIDLCRRDATYEMKTFHFHKKYELYYLFEGARHYFIGDDTYLVNAGDLVMIHSDEIHKTGSVGTQGHTRVVMNFSDELLAELCLCLDVNLFCCFDEKVHIVTVPMKLRPIIEVLFKRLYDDREEGGAQALALRKILVSELLMYCAQFIKTQDTDHTSARVKNQTISDIKCFISERYAESLSLCEIANKFYLSPSYISRLFKKTTGLSIVEYINSVRVMAAKNLLDNTALKVSEIAQQTGFATTIHFSRVFKASTALSPQQYRKLRRQNNG